MSNELDRIIEANDCNGHDINCAMVASVATEYAESDEVKRRHWAEFCLAMKSQSDMIEINKDDWQEWTITGGEVALVDSGVGLDALYKRLRLIK